MSENGGFVKPGGFAIVGEPGPELIISLAPRAYAGAIVCYVDEIAGDYNHHEHKPALVQSTYMVDSEKGRVHLHVFEAYPEDNRAVDASYSSGKEPGTWHWPERM